MSAPICKCGHPLSDHKFPVTLSPKCTVCPCLGYRIMVNVPKVDPVTRQAVGREDREFIITRRDDA